METAQFRFYADLNDFLSPPQHGRAFAYPTYDGTQLVKHLLESIAPPHTAVALIVVNGRSVSFDHLVQTGDRVSFYPPFATIDISPLIPLHPPLTPPYRFLAEAHLGKLTRYLRLLGLDTLYLNDNAADDKLARIAAETRIMLTRDRGLLKRGNVPCGYCLLQFVAGFSKSGGKTI